MSEHPTASKFSDQEMEMIQRHGAAQMGDPSFSEEVEKHLRRREANAAKMKAAQTGGGEGLGPPEIQQQQAQQTGTLQQQAGAQSQVQAAKAQAAMIPQAPSPAQVGSQQAVPAAPGGGEAPPGTEEE